MRPVADRDAADRVDGDDRADGRAVARLRGGRAEPALEVDGRWRRSPRRACRARSRAPRRPRPRSRARDRADKRPQSLSPPLLRSNRIAPGTIGTSAGPTAKPRPCSRSQACTPPGRVEAEGRPARQHDRVDALDRLLRPQQIDLARARRAAAHVREATAGSSNTIAVTPEASRASSAWPTLRPGTSVIRLRFTFDHLPEGTTCRNARRCTLRNPAKRAPACDMRHRIRPTWPPTSPFSPPCSPGC